MIGNHVAKLREALADRVKGLEFNSIGHRYVLDGIELFSATQVASGEIFTGDKPFVSLSMVDAAMYGAAVHSAIERGRLLPIDEYTGGDLDAPYLDGGQYESAVWSVRAANESHKELSGEGWELAAREQRTLTEYPTLNGHVLIAGTADAIYCRLRDGLIQVLVIDYKTGEVDTRKFRVQMGVYQLGAVQACSPKMDTCESCIVRLPGQGSYDPDFKIIPLEDLSKEVKAAAFAVATAQFWSPRKFQRKVGRDAK